MQENLIGYALNALDEDERIAFENQLLIDPQLSRELELCRESLEPLRADAGSYDPPIGLAERTCRYVALQSGNQRELAQPAALKPIPAGGAMGGQSRWSFADFAVAAGIFLAATALLFPALQHSRDTARIAACQNNLRQLHTSLATYSDNHGSYFPAIPSEPSLDTAGTYALKLKEAGLLPDSSMLVCPGDERADHGPPKIATLDELRQASPAERAALQEEMGGSYGYSLGYNNNGKYQPVKNQGRSKYVLMADAPSPARENRASRNHRGCGQNALHEDGHVEYLSDCVVNGDKSGRMLDHMYLNNEGLAAAGATPDDSVIGHSSATPILHTVSGEK